MKVTRLEKIEKMLENKMSISLNELCEVFEVSKNTIRRDVSELEKNGIVKKVYGGIIRNENNVLESFSTRQIKNEERKKHISKLAADLVEDNDIIFIDSGTTTMHMVPFLANKKNLTIITANVYVINEAFNYPQLNVIATGGTLYRPINALIGTHVIDFLNDYNISKVFLAAAGFSLEHGASNNSPMERDIKKYLTQKCKTKILLVDSTKMDKASLITFSELCNMDYFITDKDLPTKYKHYFELNNIELITP